MTQAQSTLTRRGFLVGGAGVVLASAAGAQNISIPKDGGTLSPPDAYQLVQERRIFLVDVRRPDEWASTGSGQGALRLDLRRKDFVTALDGLVAGDKDAPIALICARGVRSNRTARRLRKAGFTNIIDVPEGMLGSAAGPGWIRRKLPLDRS